MPQVERIGKPADVHEGTPSEHPCNAAALAARQDQDGAEHGDQEPESKPCQTRHRPEDRGEPSAGKRASEAGLPRFPRVFNGRRPVRTVTSGYGSVR